MGKAPPLSFTQFDANYWGYNNDPQANDQVMVEQMYWQTLTELCVNRFKWEGLPEEIDRRFIELNLHQQGLVIFFKEEKKYNRFFALAGTAMGTPNMYNNPTHFMAIGNTMIQEELDARHCVPIWANSLRIPQWRAINIYARKLAKADRTIDIMIDNLRYTRLVTGNANQRQSLVNIMRQVDDGQPLVYTTPNFDPASVQSLDLGMHPESLPKLMDARNSLWNQAMGFLGINNANQDKRERLVASEVQANDEQVLAVRQGNLNARQYAAEQINRMFGLDVSVTYDQTDSMSVVPDGIGQFDIEGDDNGNVHGNPTGSN